VAYAFFLEAKPKYKSKLPFNLPPQIVGRHPVALFSFYYLIINCSFFNRDYQSMNLADS
jgi:hypothetical protein